MSANKYTIPQLRGNIDTPDKSRPTCIIPKSAQEYVSPPIIQDTSCVKSWRSNNRPQMSQEPMNPEQAKWRNGNYLSLKDNYHKSRKINGKTDHSIGSFDEYCAAMYDVSIHNKEMTLSEVSSIITSRQR